RTATGPASRQQHARMHALWRSTGMDRDERLRFTSEIVGRPIESSKDLTSAEAEQVVERVRKYIEQNMPPADGDAANENAGATS
ncbi:hypothetical protein ACFQ07_14100, partial [Actinomadura adrarensis]